jgi:hypothetical protein
MDDAATDTMVQPVISDCPADARWSVVVPAYNEAERLPASVPSLVAAVPPGTEVIIVDDGSRDGTADVARRLLADVPHGRVVRLPVNRGKGAGVRAGISFATGDVAVFCDADGATDVGDLGRLVAALGGADIAIGSRSHANASMDEHERARLMLRSGFRRLTSALLDLDAGDTQCGFKAFRMPVAKLLFSLVKTDGFAFDVEVLALAHQLGMTVTEVPVRWTAVPGSHVRPVVDAVAMAAEVVRIRRRARQHDGRWLSGESPSDVSPVIDLRERRDRVRPSTRREVASAAGWWV